MRVLIISANTLPASPTGPAYVAGAALAAGHTVEVLESLFAHDLAGELQAQIARFQPEVIGISIRLVHGYVIDEGVEYHTRHLDLRLRVKEIVDCIRIATTAPVVLGGPGFNYYAQDWLEYLDLDYGIRGEADFSFPLYLKRLGEGGDISTVPGCVYRREGRIVSAPRERVADLDATALPAYELFDLERYAEFNIPPGILTKRGCAFRCTYCPYSAMEGTRYRLKSPGRVVAEIKHILEVKEPRRFTFCENNFNVPRAHAEAICQEIIDQGLSISWGSGDLRPLGVTDDFCQLIAASGCSYINLSIESGSDMMLQCMQRGYTVAQVRQALDSLDRSGIPYGASLMIGAPGETPETIAESLALIDSYSIPSGTWVTIGICLWTHHQQMLETARREGQFTQDNELFSGVNYMSPELPRDYMVELIANLQAKQGYTVQVNKPFAEFR